MELVTDADEAVVEAVRVAAREAGVDARAHARNLRGAWWRAGLRDALDRGALEPPEPRYGAMPPPRSTRGATRA